MSKVETISSIENSTSGGSREGFTIRDFKLSTYLPIAIGTILFGWLYMPVFSAWYEGWMVKESYYSHGPLVPVISLFVVWLKRKQLKDILIKPSAWGYAFLIPCLLMVVLLTRAGGTSIQGFVFPIILFGLVLLFFGGKMARELLFPIGYLYFMIVLPGFILANASFRIQMISTQGATELLRLLSFDVTREGQFIYMPNVEMQVAAACSGFRLLIALFALAAFFIYLTEGPWWGKAALIVLTLPLSAVMNSIRIAMVALVGNYMGSEAMVVFHDTYAGPIMLVMSFTALFYLARLVKCQKFNSTLI